MNIRYIVFLLIFGTSVSVYGNPEEMRSIAEKFQLGDKLAKDKMTNGLLNMKDWNKMCYEVRTMSFNTIPEKLKDFREAFVSHVEKICSTPLYRGRESDRLYRDIMMSVGPDVEDFFNPEYRVESLDFVSELQSKNLGNKIDFLREKTAEFSDSPKACATIQEKFMNACYTSAITEEDGNEIKKVLFPELIKNHNEKDKIRNNLTRAQKFEQSKKKEVEILRGILDELRRPKSNTEAHFNKEKATNVFLRMNDQQFRGFLSIYREKKTQWKMPGKNSNAPFYSVIEDMIERVGNSPDLQEIFLSDLMSAAGYKKLTGRAIQLMSDETMRTFMQKYIDLKVVPMQDLRVEAIEAIFDLKEQYAFNPFFKPSNYDRMVRVVRRNNEAVVQKIYEKIYEKKTNTIDAIKCIEERLECAQKESYSAVQSRRNFEFRLEELEVEKNNLFDLNDAQFKRFIWEYNTKKVTSYRSLLENIVERVGDSSVLANMFCYGLINNYDAKNLTKRAIWLMSDESLYSFATHYIDISNSKVSDKKQVLELSKEAIEAIFYLKERYTENPFLKPDNYDTMVSAIIKNNPDCVRDIEG